MPAAPRVHQYGGVYRLVWSDVHIQVEVDRLYSEKGGVYGEMVITNTIPGLAPHIHGPTRINLVASTGRTSLIHHLNDILPADWIAILEQTCTLVVRAYRMGAPAINIASFNMPDSLKMRVHPLLQERQPAVFFGEGDSFKSFFATYIATLVRLGQSHAGLTPEPGNVLVLDYETDEETFWERVNLISAGLEVAIPDGIYYRRMITALADDFSGINRLVEKHDIELLIVDSASPATIEPENAEMVTRYFQALRALGTTTLTIAHRDKAQKFESPFGSSFWKNLPRSLFLFKADRSLEDIAISLKNVKQNNGRRLAPMGFRLNFADDRLVVSKANPADYPELQGDVPLAQRIAHLLTRGSKTIKEISEDLDMDDLAHIRVILNRRKNLFTRVEALSTGEPRWGLLTKE